MVNIFSGQKSKCCSGQIKRRKVDMALYLQAHTMEINHVISVKEAEEICRMYQVSTQGDIHITAPKITGINEINITRNPIMSDGIVERYIYSLRLKINIGRLLKLSNVSMAELNKKNVQKMFRKLEKIFSHIFYLELKNCDVRKWTFSRIDCGQDLKVGTDNPEVLKAYIRLLYKSFLSTNNRNCHLTQYVGYDNEEVKNESIRINNGSYTYNIYYKLSEWIKNHGRFTTKEEMEEIKDVIRIEKQIEGKGLNVFGAGKKTLSLLLDEKLTCSVMENIVTEMELYFGSGMHVSQEKVFKIIENSNLTTNIKENLKDFFVAINILGYQKIQEHLITQCCVEMRDSKRILGDYQKHMEKLGLSVAGLEAEDTELIESDSLRSLSELLREEYKKGNVTRERGQFAKIGYDPKNDRYKANPTYHDEWGRGVRTSAAAKTKEEVEIKMLGQMKKNINKNLRFHKENAREQICCLEVLLKELCHFKTTAEFKNTKEIIESCIEQAKRKIDGINEQLCRNSENGISERSPPNENIK